MSAKHKKEKPRNRMDKFLYYSKFGLIIIVALLFMMAYSFYQQELPTSTAAFYLDAEGNDGQNIIKILILMDYSSYANNSYEHFYLIKNLAAGTENVEYDLILIDASAKSQAILDSLNEGLLLRIYQKKNYEYIIAVGDIAITPSNEIKDLFFPSSRILLYGTSSHEIFDTLVPVESVKDNVEGIITMSLDVNPSPQTLLFLCGKDEYSDVIADIAKEYTQAYADVECEILYTNPDDLDEVNDYLDDRENVSLFYVSYSSEQDTNDIKHSDIINEIYKQTNKIIYDLSPITLGDDTRNSIRFWDHDNLERPIAYLALSPENTADYNYELIEYAAANIEYSKDSSQSDIQYINTSVFVSQCIENIGIEQFPDTLAAQYDFCIDNSLIVEKKDLQTGDLIFISSKVNGTAANVDEIAIYVNDEIMIGKNEYGVICFTKLISEAYQVSFAHPYSILENP